MANVISTYQNADTYGRAAFEQMDTYLPANLLAGDFPEIQAGFNFILANSTAALAQFTVVALDNNGFLVKATATGNKAIGILWHRTDAVAADNQTVAKGRGIVCITGCFNLSADSPLVWDASFDTEEKKVAAFRGAPTPTQIVLRHRYTPVSG